MTDTIRILVVDDHALVRGALCARLAREPRFVVAGTAGSADEAIDAALACAPDVVLMDIDMPGLVCFDGARRIMSLLPDTRVIFLSGFVHDHYIEQVLSIDAGGYITKCEAPAAVIDAISAVAAGGTWYSDDVRARIVDGGLRLRGEGTRSLTSTLTPREVEILRYIALGHAKKEIAPIMGISVRTVDRHACNLMAKLGIHDRVELARYAIREGIAVA